MVTIEIRQLTIKEIYNYLSENDMIFVPPLSTRMDIQNFAVKLNEFAVPFCALRNNELVGFSACYFNNMETRVGYISTFSVVRECQRLGFGQMLLNSIIKYGSENGFKQINLKVFVSNLPAINLYKVAGFLEIYRSGNLSEMALNL